MNLKFTTTTTVGIAINTNLRKVISSRKTNIIAVLCVSDKMHMILGLNRQDIPDRARHKFPHFMGRPSKIL